MNKETLTRWLLCFAMAGFAYFWCISAALQVLEPYYNFCHTPLSVYVYGSYGVYLTVGFYFLAVATVAWVVGLYLGMRQDALSRIALALLTIAAVSVGTLATWHAPTSLSRPISLHGLIHITSAMVTFITMTMAAILYSISLKRDPHWRGIYLYALLLALLVLACLVIILAFNYWRVPLHAVFEKILVTALAAWLFLVTNHLRHTRSAPEP